MPAGRKTDAYLRAFARGEARLTRAARIRAMVEAKRKAAIAARFRRTYNAMGRAARESKGPSGHARPRFTNYMNGFPRGTRSKAWDYAPANRTSRWAGDGESEYSRYRRRTGIRHSSNRGKWSLGGGGTTLTKF